MITMLNPWFISALIIFLTIFLIKRFLISTISPETQKNLPPSPPIFPILGNLHQLGLHPHRSLQRLAQRHGPLMLLQFGSRPVLIASSADAARQIMKAQDIVFSSRPKTNLGHKLLYQQRDISSAPYGEYWRQIRSICVLQLLSAKRVQSFRSVREEETAVLVGKIRKSSLQPSQPLNLSELFASLSNDIICRAAFGKKCGRDEAEKAFFTALMLDLMRLLGSFSVGDYIPWLSWINRINGLDAQADRVAKAFDEFLDRVVDQHGMITNSVSSDNFKTKGEDKRDFVDVLLEIQEDTKKAGFPIDRDSIKAIILDMFVGGTDTTYTVLEWTMAELLRHPNILKKLQDEATEIADGKQDISETDLDKMPYLKAVIKETLRFHPPLPLIVPRESSQDTKINGFDIAAGTMVITNAWAIGRDPALWDEPEEYKPERFLNSAIDFKIGSDHFQFIPFGAGRRSCPGVLFAMTINELVLANIVHKFDWALPDGIGGEDLDMTECVGFISHRKIPLLATATRRF